MCDSCTSKMVRHCLTNFILPSANKPSSFRDTRCTFVTPTYIAHTDTCRLRDKLVARNIGLWTQIVAEPNRGVTVLRHHNGVNRLLTIML